ncbi:MAG TPA: peptidyl-prolyl cis-trans isomerase, partial [Anaeromyxobacteraceae bacterium]|nr:peptidyl-prolyl cis-trans isomerase [Anaeromyxobacteraceae bacterium]
MLRRILPVALAGLALVACTQDSGPKKTGPAVAKGNGVLITADELKARLEEQSPFIRARYSTLERKKEFLDNLVRFEVLAAEAKKQGLDQDPDVLLTLKKIMVQKLVQKNFADQSGAKDVPEADLQKYYDEHKDEFQKPKRVRLAAIVWNAPAGSPERARKLAAAKKEAAAVRAEEKKNTLAFAAAVTKLSEDAATKQLGGDLNYKSQAELEQGWGKELAAAAFTLKAGEISEPLPTDKGVYVVKVTGVQEEINRPFDAVKAQIASKLFREKRTKDFDDLVKRLKDQANVTIDEKALDAVTVSANVPGAGANVVPGLSPMPPGPHGGAAVSAPAAAPAPA